MRNLPFEPLYGGNPHQDKPTNEDSVKAFCEMEAKGKKILEKKKNPRPKSKPKPLKSKKIRTQPLNDQSLSGHNQFGEFLDNKKLIIIAIIVILVIVAIVAVIYRQRKQTKSIVTLGRRLKKLRAAK
jgi:hypothetical protein